MTMNTYLFVVSEYRRDFLEHYLDNSATTQVYPQVAEKVLQLMTEKYNKYRYFIILIFKIPVKTYKFELYKFICVVNRCDPF